MKGDDASRIIDCAISYVAARSKGAPLAAGIPVTINFHPDALHKGRIVMAALADEGVYRSQFETGTSNGGLTAHPGGNRWLWESRIFGAAYDHADPALRPKYAALNHRHSVTGGSPRFGSCHLRLAPHVLSRTSFCYPDSYLDPVDFGVAAQMNLIDLVEANAALVDPLDSYIEAHVHGPLLLHRDVEAVVLDPCYRDTPIETLAAGLPCPVEWHGGFRMHDVHLADCVTYRGIEFAELAGELMVDGSLTPHRIGIALHAGTYDPQSLKRVWHCVARFGSLGVRITAA